MRRVLSVWLPRWPLDRWRRTSAEPDDGGPFALVDSTDKGLRLAAVNEAASAGGLYPGMALTDARAVLPSIRTRTWDATADARDLKKLALWTTRYTPWTNTDGADGLLLDVTGCAHLWGEEKDLIADLHTRLEAAGFKSRISLAGTIGATWALARFGAPSPIVEADLRAALAPLPVEALRLAPDIVVILKRLGLKNVGDLYTLPRAALARRFASPQISEAVLLRLDQALGRREEPLSPLLPVPAYRSRTVFAEPALDGDFILGALGELLADLCRTLERDEKGARRLTLTAARVDGTTATFGIGTSAPSRDARHLARLFKERLDGLDPGFGLDALVLSADAVDPQASEQHSLHAEKSADRTRLAELVDRLANTLGAENVEETHFRDSHVPERAEELKPAGPERPAWPERSAKPPRPFRLFARPEPIAVTAEVPEGPPLLFVWRRLTRRVARAEGPERIEPEWWLDLGAREAQSRDYYRIEDVEGHRYWVFREGLYDRPGNDVPRWYVHGLYA